MNAPLLLLANKTDLDESLRALHAQLVPTRQALREAFDQHRRRAFWVAPQANLFPWFRDCSVIRNGNHRLLLLSQVSAGQRALLNALFGVVVSTSTGAGSQFLSRKELLAVLAAPSRNELFIGGAVDADDGVLVLYRGSLDTVVVPLDWFKPTGDGVQPDPLRFEIADFGQSVRLGDYEAATHAILYEFDKDYRRKAKARVIEQDASFGGALRRLRVLRGLAQGDFEPDISAKEIARLEKGLVNNPHAATLTALGKRLGVKPDEIPTY
jgi:hypothetical protein